MLASFVSITANSILEMCRLIQRDQKNFVIVASRDFYCSKVGEVLGHKLNIEEDETLLSQALDEVNKRHFAGVAHVAKHALAGK